MIIPTTGPLQERKVGAKSPPCMSGPIGQDTALGDLASGGRFLAAGADMAVTLFVVSKVGLCRLAPR